MPTRVVALVLLLVGAVPAAADVAVEMVVRTVDTLTRGTVELAETVTVSAQGERLRQEVRGVRGVVTRRGARYEKPGHRVVLDLLDRGVRYEIDLDAGTYTAEPFEQLRRRHEAELAAAERILRIDRDAPVPSPPVSVTRSGERLVVAGRECERVALAAEVEVALARTRGGGPVGAEPSRFEMTFDLCLAVDGGLLREVRALEARVAASTGQGPDLGDRQLRVFAARRDLLAVYEWMTALLEREAAKLGGAPLRWERVFVGPRRGEPRATLYRHTGEVTRVGAGPLDPAGFELPSGLVRDPPVRP